MSKQAVIAGATGLVGSKLLALLLNDNYYSKIISVSRAKIGITHPKLIQIITPFENIDKISNKLQGEDIFICLGSTMKKAGTKELFYRYDHDYPLLFAKLCLNNGANHLSLVSALGANSTSLIFYNQVKGKLESAICNLGYNSVAIFRPSLLLGKRKEHRFSEILAQQLFTSLRWLFHGPIKKYRGIESNTVALAMLKIAKNSKNGYEIYESNQIEAIA